VTEPRPSEEGSLLDRFVTVAAKMPRLELLRTKAERQRAGLGEFVLDCNDCGMEVHRVQASAWRKRELSFFGPGACCY
jgi:hypothetical protein